MPRPPHIVFAGAGTRGRLHAGLAVAEQVVEQIPEAVVTYVGSRQVVDQHVVRAHGYGFARVPSQPAPRSALDAVRFVTDNVAGYWAARWYLKENRVSAVVGLGGTSSAATVRAAISSNIPTILLEQDVVPGRVTRWLARSATAVCAGFRETCAYFPSAVRFRFTGNPTHPSFLQLYREPQTKSIGPTLRRLVVCGGVGDSRSLNKHMPLALGRLRTRLAGWEVVHQSGEGQLQQTESNYRAAGVDALVVAFIDDVAPVLFASDLVVCRTGGITLAEIALAGTPAILVPHPRRVDYQLPSGEVYAEAGAATVVNEAELDCPLEVALAEHLRPLLDDEPQRATMAAEMRQLARPHAAAEIARAVCDALAERRLRLVA